MASSRIDGDMYVNGNLSAGTMTIPASAVTNTAVLATAQIDASKLMHGIHKSYSQESATEAAAGGHEIHIARAAGTVIAFECGHEVIAGGDKSATFDLQKSTAGGAFATILSAVVTLNSTTPVRVMVVGTLTAGAALIDGDILKIVVAIAGSTSTYPKGIFCEVVIHENAAA